VVAPRSWVLVVGVVSPSSLHAASASEATSATTTVARRERTDDDGTGRV
jgi:hypothetical protein